MGTKWATGIGVVVVGLLMLGGARALSGAEGTDLRRQPTGETMTRAEATFAAGCFWGVEAAFRQVKGVVSTAVGFTGGTVKDPSYEQVCTGNTGHAEAVEVVYDPSTISYGELLSVFWSLHDPTTLNRQGPDWGSQYRSAIFYHTPQQQAEAETSKQQLERSHRYKRPVVTQVVPAADFYRAEEYHQRYYEKQGGGQCPIPLGPKPPQQ